MKVIKTRVSNDGMVEARKLIVGDTVLYKDAWFVITHKEFDYIGVKSIVWLSYKTGRFSTYSDTKYKVQARI